MEIPKLIILLCSTYYCFASHHSHTIPIEGYESELQDLGQHVEIPETPVKVVKITKTVAVKVPVPYPVKVKEKVPYPVPVSKPYPVPVPQIIKVPHVVTVAGKPTHQHEAIDVNTGVNNFQNQFGNEGGNSYQVQEEPLNDGFAQGGQSFAPLSDNQSYGGQGFGGGGNEYGSEGSYSEPSNGSYGYSDDSEGNGSFESRSYDQAINEYLNKVRAGGSNGGPGGYHYH